MYQVDEVISVHYAEACAAYGAVKLSAFLKDNNAIQKLQQPNGLFYHGNQAPFFGEEGMAGWQQAWPKYYLFSLKVTRIIIRF